MPKITFDRFDLGIDLRKGASTSDANRLRQMKNAYVTTGLATSKRPGLSFVATLEAGTKGLFAAFGQLNTFYERANGDASALAHANPLFKANKLVRDVGWGPWPALTDINYVDVFNGFLYVSAAHEGLIYTRHHYLDGAVPTIVTDANCPHSAGVIKLASKLFAVGPGIADTVRYTKTGNPRDWTTAGDAGFLPTGLNSRGDRSANALGTYQGKLVVLSKDGAQVWTVDPDPANMKLDSIVENVGTSFPRTVANVAGDVLFLSDYGFRSITTLQLTNNLADVDIGSPIDTLVRPVVKVPGVRPLSTFFYGSGQYICAIGNHVFVYSISRTAKISAWSEYFLPQSVDAFAELGQTLYLRCGDDVYRLDPDAKTDAGTQYEVLVQAPYMDFKSPGEAKQIVGADVVMEGGCEFSIGFDVTDPDAFTDPVRVKGNSRPGGLLPVECVGTEFSLRFRNYDASPWRLDAATIYYEVLGRNA
jgi:hypothetical protein